MLFRSDGIESGVVDRLFEGFPGAVPSLAPGAFGEVGHQLDRGQPRAHIQPPLPMLIKLGAVHRSSPEGVPGESDERGDRFVREREGG